jgi:hypothetical protein
MEVLFPYTCEQDNVIKILKQLRPQRVISRAIDVKPAVIASAEVVFKRN